MDTNFTRDLSIVICDDDPISQHIIKSLLGRKHFKSIEVFSSPEEVLSLLDSEDTYVPNIIIMDTDSDTSEISSIEATEIIKNNSPKTIIICISSSSKEPHDVSLKAIASGCDSWVDKDKEDYLGRLMARISYWVSYLEEHQKLADLYSSLGGLDISEV